MSVELIIAGVSYNGKSELLIMEHHGGSVFKITSIKGKVVNQIVLSKDRICAIRSYYFCEKKVFPDVQIIA